jgi:outer membrane protein assembly factor BamD (BamD/ComL family)
MAAVNRSQQVVRSYQTAPAVEEALAQMVFGYEKLGLEDYAADAKRVLVTNFPKSNYLERRYDPDLRFGLPAHLVQEEIAPFSARRLMNRVMSAF